MLLSQTHMARALAASPRPDRLPPSTGPLALSLCLAVAASLLAAPAQAGGPRLEPQLPHSQAVSSLAWSHDGRLAITGGRDKRLKIWDVRRGLLLQTWPVAKAEIHAGLFLGRSRRALTITGSGLQTWEVASGKVLRKRPVAHGLPNRHSFSADGSLHLYGVMSDHVLVLKEVSTAKTVWRFEDRKGATMPKDPTDRASWISRGTRCVALSPDGRRIAAVFEDGKLRLWDRPATDSRTIGQVEGLAQTMAFARNGRHVFVQTKRSVIVFDLVKGKPAGTFELFDTELYSAALSPDGQRLFVGAKREAAMFDVRSGKRIWLKAKLPTIVTAARFSPNGKRVLAGLGGALRLFNARSGATLQGFATTKSSGLAVGVSGDGRRAAIAQSQGAVAQWDLPSLRLEHHLRGHRHVVRSVALSRDGKVGLSGGWDEQIRVWNADSGRLITAGYTGVPANSDRHRTDVFALSADGQWAAGGDTRGTVRIWRVGQWGAPKKIKAHDGPVAAVRFSAASGQLYSAGQKDGLVKVWNAATSQLQKKFRVPKLVATPDVHDISLSADGRTLAVAMDEAFPASALHFFKTAFLGSSLGTIRKAHDWSAFAVALSDDGSTAVSASDQGELRLWDVKRRKRLRSLAGHQALVSSVVMFNGGRNALSGSWDGQSRVWNLETGASAMLMSSGRQWLVYTDDGYFDASPDGGRLVSAVAGGRGYRIDQLAMRNNRPDLILSRLGLGTPELIRHYRARHERRLRRLGLTEQSLAGSFDNMPTAQIVAVSQRGKSAQLRLRLTARGRRLLRYNVYLNDVPLFGALGKEIAGASQQLTETVELSAGRNKLEVEAIDDAGARSLRDFRELHCRDQTRGALHYVGFGVSQYRDQRLNLQYAHKDALELGYLFKQMAGSFDAVHVNVFVDQDVTKQQLAKAKELLQRSRVDDTVVLFVAGHGTYGRDAEAEYFYVTHDTDVAKLEQTAAPFSLIEDLLQGIPARKKLFLLDTCESGERDEPELAPIETEGKGGLRPRGTRALTLSGTGTAQAVDRPRHRFLTQRDRYIYNDLVRRSGAIVLSSSRGSELSYELDEAQNGAFTEELIAALSTKAADENGDGSVTAEELRHYTSRAVATRTGGRQNPVVDRDNLTVSIAFPRLADVSIPSDLTAAQLNTGLPPAVAATGGPLKHPPPSHGCACRLQQSRHARGTAAGWCGAVGMLLGLARRRRRSIRRALAPRRSRRPTETKLVRA